MITDEERDRIVERIRLEREVRKEFAKEEAGVKPSRWAWAESKLGLLVIGAFITGVLIPIFQTTQETIKWTRQNRYEILKYRLESARSAMKELVLTHAFVAEAFERMRAIQASNPGAERSRDVYKTQGLEMQNRRSLQNAKFVGALGLLDERERDAARHAFNAYLSSAQQLMAVLDSLALRTPSSNPEVNKKDEDKLLAATESLTVQVDSDYERVLDVLKAYLHRLEKQGENYY